MGRTQAQGSRPAEPPLPAALELLRRAVDTVPLPGGPVPSRDRYGEVGAGLLDAAQRQLHVRRASDHLVVLDEGLAHRRTLLDVSLDLLTAEQRGAGHLLESLRAVSRAPGDGDSGIVWVPIARVARGMYAPLRVTTAAGEPVPVLTANETARFLSAGVRRAVRAALWPLLAQVPEDGDSAVAAWADQTGARWLLDAAIDALVLRGDQGDDVPAAVDGDAPGVDTGSVREVVRSVLDTAGPALALLAPLVDLAFTTRVVVAGLDPRQEEHALEYMTDLVNLRDRRAVEVPRWRRLLGQVAGREVGRSSYSLCYSTLVPATISQYHLTVDVGPEVRIARSCLVSDAADASTQRLVTDLRELSTELSTGLSPVRSPVAGRDEGQGEGSGAATSAAQLARARTAEKEAAAAEVRARQLLRRWRSEAVRYYGAPRAIPAAAVGGGELRDLVVEGATTATVPRRLRAYADAIAGHELGRDVRYRDDGSGDRRHLRWSTEALEGGTSGDVQLRAGFALVSDSELRARHVPVFLGLLLVVSTALTVALLTAARSGRAGEFETEAAVTVLLLVPGFAFSRLQLSTSRQIRHRLLTQVRWAAWLGLLLSLSQAVLLVVDPPGLPWLFVAVLLLETVVLGRAIAAGRRGVPLLPPPVVPAWMRHRPHQRPGGAAPRASGPAREAGVDMLLVAPGVRAR